MLKWVSKKNKKKIQTSKLITVFLLFIWTVTWFFGLLQTNKDVSLLPALYSFVQGCLVATLPYFFLSATDRMVYFAKAKYGGNKNGISNE